MKIKRWAYSLVGICILAFILINNIECISLNTRFSVGQKMDSLNGVFVYYNGKVGHVIERNIVDGYNLGLKYQCVEFVKRYYYEHLNHKMPDSYGHAKDFFDPKLTDGQYNKRRDLIQYTNPSIAQPQINDLLIFDATTSNRYGHVAIISNVTLQSIEIIQQNAGVFGKPRATYPLTYQNGKWEIKNKRILGWLRK